MSLKLSPTIITGMVIGCAGLGQTSPIKAELPSVLKVDVAMLFSHAVVVVVVVLLRGL